MTDADRIRDLLSQKPGLRAFQIAAELGFDRTHTAAALKNMLGTELTQDNSSRGGPKSPQPQARPFEAGPRTSLSRLCRYSLECLAQESVSSISLPAEDVSNYVELSELPFSRNEGGPPAGERA